ncbi:MAG: RNA methyltransferase [Muribaculaceae bacterium]
MTNKQIQLIAGLSDVKHRRRTGLFKAEGLKCVTDTIGHFELHHLYATADAALPPALDDKAERVSRSEMQRMSSQVTTPPLIAVYAIPDSALPPCSDDLGRRTSDIIVALDCIQDPGNLGTIIRTCDWMGISHIIASKDSADCWSPKVVQSTMGAISRVTITYCDLAATLHQYQGHALRIGTFLDGENLYTADTDIAPPLQAKILIMGNEGNGISPSVAAETDRRVLIPSYPPERPTSESLNVATATAMALAIMRRHDFAPNS